MSESAPAGDILHAAKVTKRFGGLIAVNNVEFTIPTKSIVSLIGPNGAGKTTFFNIIAGIYDPTAGRIEFRGTPMIARPEGLLPDVTRRRELHEAEAEAEAGLASAEGT